MENYAEKYTDEMYATKKQVDKAVGISDSSVWKLVQEYRAKSTFAINLKNIDGIKFSFCNCFGIKNLCCDVDKLSLSLTRKLSGNKSEDGKRFYYADTIRECLRSYADRLHVIVDDNTLNLIARSESTALPSETYALQIYSDFLNKILNEDEKISSMRLEIYMRYLCKELLGVEGSVYKAKAKKEFFGDKIYDEAPSSMIPELMDDLFEFLENDNDLNPFVSAGIILFYIIYIKPFTEFNEIIAILMAKQYLLTHDVGGIAALLNLESIVFSDGEFIERMNSTQLSVDITFVIDFVIRKVKANLEHAIDSLVKINAYELRSEAYQVDDYEIKDKSEAKKIADELIKINEEDDDDDEFEEKKEIKVQPIVVDPKDPVEDNEGLIYTRNPGITTLLTGFSEDKARQVEEYLLESNPSLTRSMAYFYARHCTIGKYYTIAQYKHEVGCAYETARTSMDRLVTLGYYAKEPSKNKFVYTPIRKK